MYTLLDTFILRNQYKIPIQDIQIYQKDQEIVELSNLMYQIDRDTLQIYNQHSSKEILIRYIQEDFDSDFIVEQDQSQR